MPWTHATREPCPNCYQNDKVEKEGLAKGRQMWGCSRCKRRWTGLKVPAGHVNAKAAEAAELAEGREKAAEALFADDGSGELIEEIDRLLESGREAVAVERDLLASIIKEHDRLQVRGRRAVEERVAEKDAARYADRRTVAQKAADRDAKEARIAAAAQAESDDDVVDAPEDADVQEDGEG
jgi:hypothetical protein